MNRLFLWFVKVTGYLIAVFYYRKKIYYVNKKESNKKIKGKAIIVSNHTSVWDYPLYMFTFFARTLRVLTAELMFAKSRWMGWFLKKLGCIKVDRDSQDFSFMNESIDALNKGQVVLVFPEARVPRPHENDLLEFKPSFVYIALETGAPIIPVYTNGSYLKKERARVVIGEKIYLQDLYDDARTEKENIAQLCEYVKNSIRVLRDKLNEEEQKKEK